MKPRAPRREGDLIAIPGDYQHRALLHGPPAQRFWHHAKLALTEWLFPVQPGLTLVDVGCGSGVFADHLRRLGAQVLGVDASLEAVAYARRTFGREGLEFRHGYLDNLALQPGSFDAAACLEVIEHVYAHQAATLFEDLIRILKPGGKLLVTTPNYRGVWPLVEWAADRFAATACMDEEQHVTHFHRNRLKRMLEEAGFEVLCIKSFSTLAPFLAPLTWRGARFVDRLERGLNLPFGNLLGAVAKRPAQGDAGGASSGADS